MTLDWLRAMRLKTLSLLATPLVPVLLLAVLAVAALTVPPRPTDFPRSVPGTLQPGRRPLQPMPPSTADAAAALTQALERSPPIASPFPGSVSASNLRWWRG